MSLNRQLAELARLYGVKTSYLDMAQRRREADPRPLAHPWTMHKDVDRCDFSSARCPEGSLSGRAPVLGILR